MDVPFLFAFAIFLASSEARYKPKLEIYEIRGNGDRDGNIEIKDLINDSEDRSDTTISKLLKPSKKELDVPRPKSHKLSKIVDALIHKLKSLRVKSLSSNEPQVYLINGNLIIDEENNVESKFVDETRTLPTVINRKDLLYALFGESHRNKRPVLRGQNDDRTAPPPHRYVYDSDGSY